MRANIAKTSFNLHSNASPNADNKVTSPLSSQSISSMYIPQKNGTEISYIKQLWAADKLEKKYILLDSTHISGSSRLLSISSLIWNARKTLIVYNHTSKRSMKNSVTFISVSVFSCDNGAQKRQKFILSEGFWDALIFWWHDSWNWMSFKVAHTAKGAWILESTFTEISCE